MVFEIVVSVLGGFACSTLGILTVLLISFIGCRYFNIKHPSHIRSCLLNMVVGLFYLYVFGLVG